MKLCIILGIMFVAWIVVAITGIILESINFNKGLCSHCETKMEFFDTDSQGGRGYKCPYCGRIVWVSYCFVDNKRRK